MSFPSGNDYFLRDERLNFSYIGTPVRVHRQVKVYSLPKEVTDHV